MAVFYEYFCAECGWYASEKIQNDSDNANKKISEKIKKHQSVCKNSRDIFSCINLK